MVAPVSIYGIFARVLPGTRMELRMQRITDSLWLVSRFSMDLVLSKFWLHATQRTVSTYSDYRRNKTVLDELLSMAAQ